jgi:exodeoxyribonuclease VII small subunit
LQAAGRGATVAAAKEGPVTDPKPAADASAAEEDLPDFERALEELEALVERMESGELTLDASLAAFERGIHLTRRCQQALADAEQRVRVLLEREDGSLETAPFDAPDAGDDDG